MTNDDRSNEDRTGDGQPPHWGAARDQEPPRYGERTEQVPPRYGERTEQEAPRYGERTDQTPQYGEQYGQQPAAHQYGQQSGAPTWGDQHQVQHQPQHPYAASAAPANSGPAWQSYQEPQRKKKTLGVIAFVVALVALALAIVAGIVFGSAFGGNDAIRQAIMDGSAATQSGQEELQRRLANDPALLASAGGGGIAALIGTVLGLWAIVQGIIAIVTKRGRAFGIIALVVAVVSPVVLYITFAVALGSHLA
ncbi:hypothetical protein [Curtobacterium sp. ISL-83]|uniref:hypothetical protein n=1 Tax=Curtobacterium sp. ISL-83 TaxID=2819145 RepID=UPI001BE8696D|nr:hypothetical protein [Curtobacterium sp. ISL-83]MBT2501993.1 hypothetical protein [Curtobacterium sp. ISL-83]